MRRFDRLRRILALDPERDCVEIYRLLALYEFPWDVTRALEFALFRTYAVPSIGALLDRTGEFARCPQKRYDDTDLLLREMLQSEPDSDRATAAVTHLNQIHGRYAISNDDYLYTLSTFVVMPVRWLRAYGWRTLHPREVEAITHVVRRMGEGMRIEGIPRDYAEFEKLLDGYERDHFGYHPGSRRVAESTMDLFGSWFPWPLSRFASRGALLLMDPHLVDAFRFEHPPELARRATGLALRARAGVVRQLPPRPDSRPARARPRTYPDGYEITELGPESFHRWHRRKARAGAR